MSLHVFGHVVTGTSYTDADVLVAAGGVVTVTIGAALGAALEVLMLGATVVLPSTPRSEQS